MVGGHRKKALTVKRGARVSCLTCDDGCGLTSHLVLVHILAVVQFPLHQNPGAGRDNQEQESEF